MSRKRNKLLELFEEYIYTHPVKAMQCIKAHNFIPYRSKIHERNFGLTAWCKKVNGRWWFKVSPNANYVLLPYVE